MWQRLFHRGPLQYALGEDTDVVHLLLLLLQIRVFCRVRPHPQSVVRCLAGGTALSLGLDNKEHAFAFDKVFGPGTQQQQVRPHVLIMYLPADVPSHGQMGCRLLHIVCSNGSQHVAVCMDAARKPNLLWQQ